jgi:cell division FtsZ-interacting protein ZapD
MLLSRWRTSVSSCHPTSAKRVASLRTRIAGPKACCRAELPFLSQFLLVRTYATMAEKTINLIQLLSACIDLAHQAGKEIKVIAESGDLGAKGKDKRMLLEILMWCHHLHVFMTPRFFK